MIPITKDTARTIERAVQNPLLIQRELNTRSFYRFLKYFWPVISPEKLVDNWHIKYLCDEIQKVQIRVENGEPKEYDLLINIPPGTTKTTIVSVLYPVWAWTRAYHMRFISLGYSATLSLEAAELSRDLIRSGEFKEMYPELDLKADKDVKSNYRVVKIFQQRQLSAPNISSGGNRYSTSIGGTLTGFHGHVILVDDPLNPGEATSTTILDSTNRWMDQVLSTRKVDKEVTVIIMVMQRIHQNDPSGHWLKKKKDKIKHICLPAEINTLEYTEKVNPPELKDFYVNGLLDPVRLNPGVLKELKTDLGQYGYAGQMGQTPTPPKGGMFQVDHFQYINTVPADHLIAKKIRYWDKAGSAGKGAYTAGVKMFKLKTGEFVVVDVKRGQWATHERERIIKETAIADGIDVEIWIEQEPGSGGKESAENTVINLTGYACHKDLPRGDKVYRADPYSVQVNEGRVWLLTADWNHEYVEEHRFFPLSTYKDQVDASSGAFSKLTAKKETKTW